MKNKINKDTKAKYLLEDYIFSIYITIINQLFSDVVKTLKIKNCLFPVEIILTLFCIQNLIHLINYVMMYLRSRYLGLYRKYLLI